MNTKKIYLASSSPRRRELLQQIGVDFSLLLPSAEEPHGSDVDETVLPSEMPQDYVARIAHEKVMLGQKILLARQLPIMPILAADTTVTIDGKILGKPATPQEANEILKQLSGRTHQVLTAIAVSHDNEIWQTTCVSDVTFSTLSDKSIQQYCASSEPYDKAGAYGIQGMAAVFIKHISGSYSSIMGLPLYETAQLLKKAGIHTL